MKKDLKKLFLLFILFIFSICSYSSSISPKKYNRIVSLTLSGDEMLLSLVEADRVAGLSGKINQDRDFSNIVEEAKKYPKLENNIETLIELEPDFVIAADWMKKDILLQISDVTDNLYVYKTPKTFTQQKNLIRELSKLLMVEDKGEKIIESIDRRLEKLQERIKKLYKGEKPKILFYSTYEITAGLDTSFQNFIDVIYGVNAAAIAGIKGSEKISKEKVIELNPDIIVIPIGSMDNSSEFANFVKKDPSFQNLKAIKNNKVITVPYRVISSTSQYMIDGLEELANKIYNLD